MLFCCCVALCILIGQRSNLMPRMAHPTSDAIGPARFDRFRVTALGELASTSALMAAGQQVASSQWRLAKWMSPCEARQRRCVYGQSRRCRRCSLWSNPDSDRSPHGRSNGLQRTASRTALQTQGWCRWRVVTDRGLAKWRHRTRARFQFRTVDEAGAGGVWCVPPQNPLLNDLGEPRGGKAIRIQGVQRLVVDEEPGFVPQHDQHLGHADLDVSGESLPVKVDRCR